jgi:hypothetical protein
MALKVQSSWHIGSPGTLFIVRIIISPQLQDLNTHQEQPVLNSLCGPIRTPFWKVLSSVSYLLFLTSLD